MKLGGFIVLPLMGAILVLGACTGGLQAAPVTTSDPAAGTGRPAPPLAAPAAIPVEPPVTPATPNPAPVPYNPNSLPFSINSTQTPAPLVLSNFSVNPSSLRLFGTSTISVLVTNTGTLPVSYGVTLMVRTASGTQRATITPGNTQVVNLAGGESITVSFNVTGLGNGTHIVYIDQLWDRLSVDSQV